MLIAVTGSSGTVGQDIVRVALAAGHDVKCIDKVESAESSSSRSEQARLTFDTADLTSYEDVLRLLRGCDAVISAAAIPSPLNHPDHIIHNLNVVVSYNVLRACAELGIKRVCQLSSVNAIGLAFTPYHRKYHYFPLDEKHPYEPADSYALSKQICEIQADSICRAFPHMRVASIRPHACLPGLPKPLPVDPEERAREMAKYGDREALEVNDCFAWVLSESAAKACLLAITSEGWSGSEAFFIAAPDTTSRYIKGAGAKTSLDLAREFHPGVPLRAGWFEGEENKYRSFFDTSKAERMLGWKHGM